MRRLLLVMWMLLAGALLAAPVFAQGMMVRRRPPRPDIMPRPIPPERLKMRNFGITIARHEIEVTIKDQVATTKITQVFRNPNRAMLEGDYLFPLPEAAAINDFAMTMNGKMVRGEILEAGKARQIYEGIVRRMKDPGLLEYVGRKLFRARVFPVTPEGDTTVTLSYSELLKHEGGLTEYVYPLNTSKYTDLALGAVSVKVTLENTQGLKAIYSPTNSVDVTRKGNNEAIIGYEGTNIKPSRDFKLYYTTSTSDLGVNLVSSKPAGEDGYFMVLISPKTEYAPEELQPKDVLFVVDTSGSMAEGGKMKQARGALRYCINSLGPRDRFNVISFSTAARTFRNAILDASEENKKAAVQYVNRLSARGGTAINEALMTTLAQVPKGDDGRICMVVFLTDGVPTIGERNVKRILQNVKGRNPRNVRLFTFGMGDDVNTHLLDTLAQNTQAARAYVSPQEDIELKVSNFFDKVASPVLANLALEFVGARVYDLFPRKLPDLFKGGQLVVFGRYSSEAQGARALRLSGMVNGQRKEFVFEGSFAAGSTGNDHLARLWAVRKVGYLMDQIRLNGANAELRKEIVRLGTRFGIVTPYTSFLVVEDTPQAMVPGRPRPGGRPWQQGWGRRGANNRERTGRAPNAPGENGSASQPADGGGPAPDPSAEAPPAHADGDALRKLEGESRDQGAQSGAGAVQRSEKLEELKRAKSLDALDDEMADRKKPGDKDATLGLSSSVAGKKSQRAPRRALADKVFVFFGGVWVDTTYDPGKMLKELVTVQYLSDAYFKLIDDVKGIARYLSIGQQAIIVVRGKAYRILKELPKKPEGGTALSDGDKPAAGK